MTQGHPLQPHAILPEPTADRQSRTADGKYRLGSGERRDSARDDHLVEDDALQSTRDADLAEYSVYGS